MSISDPSIAAPPEQIRSAAPLVRTLDAAAFDAACAELMRMVLRDGRPEALVGIRTGGLVVAEAMARSVTDPPPVLPLTSRRAGTGAKSRIGLLPRLLKALPRPVVDRLRLLELRLLSRRRRRTIQEQHVDQPEADAVRARLAGLPPGSRVLVVDDAVDSGVTLAAVLRLLRETCDPGIDFRSAVITVTLDDPLVEPDYTLFRGVPCRFPWSFDAAR